MRFLAVRLRNWRNFADTERLPLQRRVVLVGPNASGKSNLLDAFGFLRDVASSSGGLQHAVARRGGVSAVRSLAARRYSEVALEVDVGTGRDAPVWRYELAFTLKQRRAMVIREVVACDGSELLRRPDERDRVDDDLMSQTHLEQVNTNQAFRPLAQFLESVRYLHLVPQLVREPDRWASGTEDPYGGDLLARIAETPAARRKSRLARIEKALRVAVPQLRNLELWRDQRGIPHLRGLYEHWRPKAGWQAEDQFSDGTLRLLGLLWATLDGTGPLLLEEPELSLHPEVVRHIPQMLARLTRSTKRQVILSTHSWQLLEDSGLAPDEVLMLRPGHEGSTVQRAVDIARVRALLESGCTIAEAVVPATAPRDVEQLALFGG